MCPSFLLVELLFTDKFQHPQISAFPEEDVSFGGGAVGFGEGRQDLFPPGLHGVQLRCQSGVFRVGLHRLPDGPVAGAELFLIDVFQINHPDNI